MKRFFSGTITIASVVVVVAVAVVALFAALRPGTQPDEAADGHPAPGSGSIDLERRVTDFTAGLGKDGGYQPPTREERRTVAKGVALLLEGRRKEAERRLADVEYGIRTVRDRATGRRFAEVADLAEAARVRRGWGSVYVDLSSPARWSVQVPHPVADRDTERLGVRVLRGRPGGVLVLAGAHRRAGQGGAADVAHRRDTVFHAVCAELAAHGLPGIQLHGFADDSAPEYDAVISTGSGRHGLRQARALARALSSGGRDVCRAWARTCPLAGRGNVQSKTAAARRVPFLHVEFSRDLRNDAGMEEAVAALTAATTAWA